MMGSPKVSAKEEAVKRKRNHDSAISPPPLRRKVVSGTTQTAIASFFTPASQKPPEKVTWIERGAGEAGPKTLLVGRYVPAKKGETETLKEEGKRRKVAAFDFDSTLIETSSGKKFTNDANDWKWWHSSVPQRLRKMYHEEGFRIVIISNQGGLSLKPDTNTPKSKNTTFKTKVSAVLNQLDLPISIYAATEKDIFRKPRTGMWTEILKDYDIHESGVLDLQNSIFVGDAGGRHADGKKPKDFSCSDRNFAENVGIQFHTPEELFLGESPGPFTRTFEPSEYLSLEHDVPQPYSKRNDCDIVLFCGSPGAGKSTFYWSQLEPLGYTRVNQDILKTRERCLQLASQCLGEGKSVAVDNTNADLEVRSKWIQLAVKHSVPIRCVLFTTESHICEHNDVVRALNSSMNPEKRTILPGLAFKSFISRFQAPETSEGFQDITAVAFKFNGSQAEREIWSRYWT